MRFPSISCDWLTISHRVDDPIKPLAGGRTLKLDRDGVIDYEVMDWEKLYCPSSDTSLRIRCDGYKLQMTGNVSRWKQENNLLGLTVVQCVEVWRDLIETLDIQVPRFGERVRVGSAGEGGTYLTRVDLAGNLETENFSALCHALMNQRVGQKVPQSGKYGPTWGYGSKRGNWVKSKLYDKTAEIEGRRTPSTGATVARYEVQLGSEFLKREGLDFVKTWYSEVHQMTIKGLEQVYQGGNIERKVHALFADQVFREVVPVNSWEDIPARLRGIAYAWRGGDCLKNEMSKTAFYRARRHLLEYGIDIAVPCNVLAFTARVREVKCTPIHALRMAA
jgi:hypothetical protein